MSKKTARLYQRMQHGIQGKKDEVARLEEKAAAAVEEKKSTESKVSGKEKGKAKTRTGKK